MIEATAVTKRYRRGTGERTVLDRVSLSVEPGRFVAIMGPSGSGKSTLLHILGGLDRDHEGTVRIEDAILDDCDDDALAAIRRHHIGFVHQAFNLVPVLSALENVALPGVIDARPGRACEARAVGLLERLGLAGRGDQRPSELSGGEQQRVAIARALFLEPKVVLADEPTGNLDTATGAEVMEALTASCRHLGHALVLVTHDATVAAAADEVLVLRDGILRDPLIFEPDTPVAGRVEILARWLSGPAAPSRDRRRPLVAR